ncbi:MAG: L-threonylcarbamoyladenylate synthase [Patescibacteria group bacterium]
MKILQLHEVGVEAAAKEAALVLRKGGIVLYPTDTLYGLAVDAGNIPALTRLRELKGREKKKPISIVVKSHTVLEEYAELTEEAHTLAQRFLPGPLTLVVPARPAVAAELLLNGAVGLRIPNHPFTTAFSRIFGKPYTATSANRSGLISATSVAEAIEQFGPRVQEIDLVIDAGICENNTPSTVLIYQDGILRVLREGKMSREELGLI